MAARIGLLGGTFDPPHHGHLIVAAEAYDALSLDELVFVPAADPPHKTDVATSAQTRLEMIQAATANDPRFRVDDLEIQRGGTSYTVDTLTAYRKHYPDAELVFLLGIDQFRDFAKWREPDRILELASLGVMARAGETPAPDAPYHAVPITVSRIDISATMLRERVSRGRSIRYFVPDVVAEIVQREGLYQSAGGVARDI